MRKSFIHSLAAKTGTIVILVEIVVLSIFGAFYVNRFSREIDRQVEDRVQIPGVLMAEGVLSYSLVANGRKMERLVGQEVEQGMILSIAQRVFHTMNPETMGKRVAEIPGLNPDWFTRDVTQPFIRHLVEGQTHYLISVTPIFAMDGRTPFLFVYLKINTTHAQAEKAAIVRMFLFGSVAAILVTSLAIFLIFEYSIFLRLNAIVQLFKRVEEGDLTVRATGRIVPDEIGILQNGVNSMIANLQKTIQSLQESQQNSRRNERILRRIIDIVPSMIFVKNAQGRFLLANQAVADSYGMSVDELVGVHQGDVYPNADQLKRLLAEDQAALETGRPLIVPEAPYEDYKGNIRWLEVTKVPCDIDEFGEPAIVGLASDITARRKAEARIQESERHYRTVFENTGTGTVISEMDTTLSMVNSEFANMVGYSREEIEGRMSWTRFIAPADVDRMKDYHYARREGPGSAPVEWECSLLDRVGKERRVMVRARLIPDTQTSIATFLDITSLKTAEAALVNANRMLRLVLDTIPVRVFWKDTACRYLGGNRSFAEDAGLSTPELLIGKTDHGLAFSRHAEAYQRNDRKIMASGKSVIGNEFRRVTPDGRTVWLQSSKVPMRDADENIIGVLGTYHDITESKRAVQELQRLRNYLSNIINSMPSVLVGLDTERRVTQWNKRAEAVTGLPFEVVQHQPLIQVFPRLAAKLEDIDIAISERRVLREPKIAYRKQGETRFEDVTIFPLVTNGVEGVVIRVDDVTERVRMEEMVIQSEKMLSMGGLAAGMAHEINNPLAGILQNTAVIKNRLFGDLPANRRAAEAAGASLDAIRHYLELRKLPVMLHSIRDSGERAAAIVKNMLGFARKSEQVISSQDLGQLLDQALELVQADYDMKKRYDFKKIKIVREFDAAADSVRCEASKIQQVFLNILKNGAEAMAGQADPIFFLRLKNEGDWVQVEIEDNGPGMDEETRRRIFEPFFTTKPVGKGTGLGLSVSYFIISEDHGGRMDVFPAKNGGSRFVIHLPREKQSVKS
jgi:PAS domain S-box-containing protein